MTAVGPTLLDCGGAADPRSATARGGVTVRKAVSAPWLGQLGRMVGRPREDQRGPSVEGDSWSQSCHWMLLVAGQTRCEPMSRGTTARATRRSNARVGATSLPREGAFHARGALCGTRPCCRVEAGGEGRPQVFLPATMTAMTAQQDPMLSPPISPPDSIDVDVMVFPRETEGERGLYHDSVITLVKELREAGATASFQHSPEMREWIGEKALSPIEISFLIGIASNAGWAAIAAVLRRRHRAGQVRARIARYRGGASWKPVGVNRARRSR